nr:unnamed protein product [Digitaria exilis]
MATRNLSASSFLPSALANAATTVVQVTTFLSGIPSNSLSASSSRPNLAYIDTSELETKRPPPPPGDSDPLAATWRWMRRPSLAVPWRTQSLTSRVRETGSARSPAEARSGSSASAACKGPLKQRRENVARRGRRLLRRVAARGLRGRCLNREFIRCKQKSRRVEAGMAV